MLDNTLRKKICGTLALDGCWRKKAFLNYAEIRNLMTFFSRHGSISISQFFSILRWQFYVISFDVNMLIKLCQSIVCCQEFVTQFMFPLLIQTNTSELFFHSFSWSKFSLRLYHQNPEILQSFRTSNDLQIAQTIANWQFPQSKYCQTNLPITVREIPRIVFRLRTASTALNWEGRGQMICDFFWHLRLVFCCFFFHARTYTRVA